jgi:hypothetical protein
MPPEDTMNVEVLDHLMGLDLNVEEQYKVSPFLTQYLKYARATILK